tara:strand:- start:13679 stop:15463 length:1785 start_codon:yes stop_codon:yes gene_type:complete
MINLKKSLRLAVTAMCAGAAISVAASAAVAQDRVGDFALLDHEGVYHNMSWYDNNKAVALFVQVNGDAASQASLEHIDALRSAYEAQGVVFMMINPLGQARDSVKSVAADHEGVPVLIDDTQLISEALNIQKSGEVLLYSPSSFRVMFRGPAGKELEAALQAVVEGSLTQPVELAASGTDISYPVRDRNMAEGVSYSKDVAPVLAKHCADCHRDGGIAPFAMDSHAMAQGWSPMIREVLMTKRMPPAQIDPHIGEFSNSYNVPFEDQQKILHWIAQGSPRDGDVDPLATIEWPETEWAFGEPDLIVDLPPQEIPATGVLDYINVMVPISGMTEDRWLKASQYIPSDRTVLHHTLNALIEPGQRPKPGLIGSFTHPDQPYVTPYIPGAEPYIEDENTGGLLKAGTTLALNMHYTTNGRATVDQGRIGLWFYDEDETPTQRKLGECACIFPNDWTDIPPNDPNFAQVKSVKVGYDAYLTGFHPHMHFRGKSMVFDAHYPDGRVERLLNIAHYNYDWQIEYKLAEPKFVPAGTEIVVTGVFDNSSQNKANPDPERQVPWGEQSWDEMFFGQVYWKAADPAVLDQLRARFESRGVATN